jgi:hypothetical protein
MNKMRNAWSLVGLLAASALAGACSPPGQSVFTAHPYDPEAQCLAEYEALALVETTELSGSCDPLCVELDGTLYVTTLCGPYPEAAIGFDASDETCAGALAAPPCE